MVMSSSRIHGARRTSELAFSVELRRAIWTARALDAPAEAGHDLLLAQLRHVYAELARAAEIVRHDPIAGPFAAMDLTRWREAIESDLHQLHGEDWDSRLPLLAETHAYAQRVRRVAGTSAGAFVAHHYTRYLGDLSGAIATSASGGQQARQQSPPGRRFKTPHAIAQPEERKRGYRLLLDTAPWSALDKQLIIGEALHAHRLNAALLTAVSRSIGQQRASTRLSA
jgi:heme oxygenase